MRWSMRVRDLPSEALLVQDSQDRRAVLESVGLGHGPGLDLEALVREYPTLFVEVGEGEYRKVWGIRRLVPYLDEPVEVLYAAA